MSRKLLVITNVWFSIADFTNDPNKSCPDLSTVFSQPSRSALVALMESWPFRLHLKTFPRLFTGFSETDGLRCSPSRKQNLSVTVPFLRTKDLDFTGLKLMRAHDTILPNPWRIHLATWSSCCHHREIVHDGSDGRNTCKSQLCEKIKILEILRKTVMEKQ